MFDVSLRGRAFHYLKEFEQDFLDQIKPYGYTKDNVEGVFDLVLQHAEFGEKELADNEYFVVFPDNSSEYLSYGELIRKYQL